ncbi:hypothetical protein Leryth_005996 [Lithospermum erythrorhizon]|nr:hypothetical protein Leryth_005996 [Lithospermum erythrorhizon]
MATETGWLATAASKADSSPDGTPSSSLPTSQSTSSCSERDNNVPVLISVIPSIAATAEKAQQLPAIQRRAVGLMDDSIRRGKLNVKIDGRYTERKIREGELWPTCEGSLETK